MNRSIFFNDWQACLRAHYIHVIRTGDNVTEPTLRHVLLQTGLTDADLLALAEEARAMGWLSPDTEFDPAAGGVEIATIEPVSDDAPLDDAVADVDEIDAGEDDAYPDQDAIDAPYEDDIERGYDEREPDDAPDDAGSDSIEPPDEPPTQQLSLF